MEERLAKLAAIWNAREDIDTAFRDSLMDAWGQGTRAVALSVFTGVNYQTLGKIIRSHPRYAELKESRKGRGANNPLVSQSLDPKAAQLQVRRRRMFAQYLEGDTLQAIADREGLTRQRIEQILNRHQPYRELREKAARQKAEVVEKAMKLWTRGYSIANLARLFGTGHVSLGEAMASHPRYAEIQAHRPQYKDAAKIQEMVDFYNKGNSLQKVANKFTNNHVGAAWRVLKKHPDYRPRTRGDYHYRSK